jgi:hypothetical protein
VSDEDVWYPIIEDLHNYSKMRGGSLEYMAEVVYHELTEIFLKLLPLVNDEKFLGTAVGDDLDKVSAIVDIFRFSQETDTQFRTRVIGFIASLERNTIPSIKNIFYSLAGQYPEIEEAWTTQVYSSGDIVQENYLLAQFRCRLPYNINHVREVVRVIDDGSGYGLTVQASNYPLLSTSFDSPNGAWLRSDYEKLITGFGEGGAIFGQFKFGGGYKTQWEIYFINIYDSHNDSTGIVTLQALGDGPSGKFPKGTLVEIEYDIVANPLWNLNEYEYYSKVLDEYTAAGVKSSLDIYYDMTEWIYGDEENIEIIDYLGSISQIWLEPFTLPTTTTQRGSGHWGVGFWGTPDSKWGGHGFPNATRMIDED